MIDNIIHKGKPGMLKHTLRVGAGTWNAVRKPKNKYYVRAERRSAGVHKCKREINLKFNWMHYIDAITTDYNVFMSSWFDSYLAVMSQRETTARIDLSILHESPTSLSDFVEQFCVHINDSSNDQLQANVMQLVGNQLGSFGSPRGSDIYPTNFAHTFVRISATSTCISNELIEQSGLYLVCTFLGSSDLLYEGGDYKNFEGLKLPTQSTTNYNVPQPIFLKVNEMALSDYGNLADNNSQIAFRQLHFLRGEVPLGYDDSYNEQMWLPLLDNHAKHRPFNRTSMQPVLRSTQCLWALGSLNNTHTDHNRRIPVKFLGECYKYDSTLDDRVEHKADLAEYPLTTDSSLRGKGYLYVDDGDVCYCPITGFALECVIEALPEYSDATGNSYGLE